MDNRITDEVRALCGVSAYDKYSDFGGYEVMRGRVAEACDKIDKAFDKLKAIKLDASEEREWLLYVCGQIIGNCRGLTSDEMAKKATEELKVRLMPEGTEWPTWTSGEPVLIGQEYMCWCGKTHAVNNVTIWDNGSTINETSCHPFISTDGPITTHGERVKRPAPKVLDADGVEIRKGDTVYTVWNFTGHSYVVEDASNPLEVAVRATKYPEQSATFAAKKLTHRAPVLAADGKPLRGEQTVYNVETGCEFTVHYDPKDPTRVPIYWYEDDMLKLGSAEAASLTHERPVIDSWERIEEDAKLDRCEYNKTHGYPSCCIGCDGLPLSYSCSEIMARDLVRRCKALAERDA